MVMTLDEATRRATARQDLCSQVKQLLVDRLSLDVDPQAIGDDQPLFGRGLELDSIDTLELAMAVEDTFGVTVTDDDTQSLLSLNRLVDHIEGARA
ncbi:acyl carrier protein [Streptomyces piniterrae]|uniref:Acyl carrier protein n=1 Tax=Streptomyces piniterrae TaxID=2571125 RepID=A0A4U0NWS6_9ACTN|nr:phosphopantetheine-binding protein [Streptomyces piniterrae]TJZ59235.1 acyl carrier protein [Streptomyces piniterrae]